MELCSFINGAGKWGREMYRRPTNAMRAFGGGGGGGGGGDGGDGGDGGGKCVKRNITNSPLPLRPTNLKSLNLATWFFMSAVEFLSSAQQFSSLPARTVTRVPSPTSPRATTLKATGRVLLDLQCAGRTVQTKCGEPVWPKRPFNFIGCKMAAMDAVRIESL